MKQHLLENGLKAVADYYLGCSKHVQASYERACRVVRKFYGEFGFEEYNPAHDDEIMNKVLAGRTLTPESSYMFCRYVFRVLEMMKDYFAGRPFRKKYPMFSRYKFELEPEYLNFTNEFRDWLKLEPQTMLFQPNPAIKNEHRDQFYMILLYDTGARNSELLNLRLQDVVIDTSTPYIIIRGKGKKIRSVPIMMETVRHFESYIKRFHKTTDPDSLLFYTIIHRQIQRMSDDNVARFIQKYATKAKAVCPTVPEKVTPHMFRHSRALNLYRKGVPLPLIAEWLGHSNLETTLIYAYADTEMKRAAIEKATGQNHPLRSTETFIEEHLLDDDMIKKLYGLC